MSQQFYRQQIKGNTPQDIKNINDNFEKLFLYLFNSVRGIDFDKYVVPNTDVTFQDVICSTLAASAIGAVSVKKGAVECSVEGHTHTASDVTNFLDKTYPVGSIHINVTGTNPGTQFGGTWTAFGSGKTLIGVDTGQTEFDTVEETGGEKTHTLTEAEMPVHHHHIAGAADTEGADGTNYSETTDFGGSATATNHNMATDNAGSGSPHNNLPPYITVFFWKRTA